MEEEKKHLEFEEAEANRESIQQVHEEYFIEYDR